MVFLYTLFIVLICFSIFFFTRWLGYLRNSKISSFINNKTEPTMFNVRNLIINGERRKAIQVYLRIFQVNEQEASQAIDDLIQHINKR